MAFAATMSTGAGIERQFSEGPVKKQYFTWTCASGDASGTITATGLTSVLLVVLDGGLAYSTAPTYATNVATLTFTATTGPGAGSGFAIGK